ncbi:hypothetical protein [Ferrimonas marina]|uniref:Uncharacterized protein n=1 Tax=Ferrimonas marina TaxID=299255 RepID=A0A1M5MGX0_9GAMM|nr:hypothetical protein [Ferrimonas marina]SHG76560.1 hypothetical protein SAMN02745129_0643 [Ferrimonas marina]
MAKLVSTSALAKARGLSAKVMFERLERAGYLVRSAQQWQLTPLGQSQGGVLQQSEKFGRYVVWPDSLNLGDPKGLLTPHALAERLGIDKDTLLLLLQELGWLRRGASGWQVTADGQKGGGVPQRQYGTGRAGSLWPESMVDQPVLKQRLAQYRGEVVGSTHEKVELFKQRFDAKLQTMDGHYVRHADEVRVANFLYLHGISYAYQRPVPGQVQWQSDFYLPSPGLYLETDAPDPLREERLAWYLAQGWPFLHLDSDGLDARRFRELLGVMGVPLPGGQ